jgi:hypothetical protein
LLCMLLEHLLLIPIMKLCTLHFIIINFHLSRRLK